MKWNDSRFFLTLFFLNLSFNVCFSQGEANNWYFGSNAGISFNTSPPSVLNDGQLNTNEGCSSISNANGDLLFYTDGRTIWNADHQIMSNADYFGGSGLNGDPSSTSSGLIVPHPTEEDLYFVFTVDEPHHENAFAFPNQGPANPDGSPRTTYSDTNQPIPQADDGFNNGFAYSVVDMSLNGGLGDVLNTQKNIGLITYDTNNSEDVKFKCSEKITAVRGDNCNSIWVITHFKDTFYAFFIDDNGLNETPVTSSLGPFVSTDDYRRAAIGYLKASPNGDKLITANQTLDYDPIADVDQGTGNVYLFDFNSITGVVSNPLELVSGVNAYGVEFSPEGTKAYASVTQSDVVEILQWDLSAADIPNSIFALGGVSGSVSGAIQLAPNGKIYRSRVGQNALAVINNPELPGNQANYTESLSQGAINLGGNQANFGLPPFIQSLFASRIDIVGTDTQQVDLCDGEIFTLSYQNIANADYTWSLDGEVLNGETNSFLDISQPPNADLPLQETYTLDVDLNDGSCGRVGIANVTYFPFPETNTAQLTECVQDLQTNSAEFNLTQANDLLINSQAVEQNFDFSYYESLSDAQNDINSIENPESYVNTSTPQTLSVNVENISSGCSSITELTLDIQDFDVNEYTLKRCDDNQTGIQTFDLSLIQAQENLTADSFYLTENDALNEINSISNPTDFANENPFQQDVFFTIENGTPCKDLGVLSLEVVTLPNIADGEVVFYCVEQSPNPITLSSGVPESELNNFEFTWVASGETTSEIAVNELGIYEVGITSVETGCTNFKTIEVMSSGLPTFDLNIEEFDRDNNSVEVIISENSLGNYEFALDNPAGPFQDSNIFENVLPGIHDIYVRDKNGCGVKQKTFGVLGIMPFFTPNDDGINDVWSFKGVFNNKQALAFVYIFDRYGKLLKYFRGLDKFWDGFYNNKPMPSQDYWYKIVLEDGRNLSGHFTLKR